MRTSETFPMAVEAIRTNKLRSFLTLVGIVTQRDFMDVARDLLEAKLAGDGGAG